MKITICNKCHNICENSTSLMLDNGVETFEYDLCDNCVKEIKQMMQLDITKLGTLSNTHNSEPDSIEQEEVADTYNEISTNTYDSIDESTSDNVNTSTYDSIDTSAPKKRLGKGIVQSKIEKYGRLNIEQQFKSGEKTIQQLADEIGISKPSLCKWLGANKIYRDKNQIHRKLKSHQSQKRSLTDEREKNNTELCTEVNKQESKEQYDDYVEPELPAEINIRDIIDKEKIEVKQAIVHTNTRTLKSIAEKEQERNIKEQGINLDKNKIDIVAFKGTKVYNELIKHKERSVEIKKGICVDCVYRDKDIGSCIYSFMSNCRNTLHDGLCDHFVNKEAAIDELAKLKQNEIIQRKK